VEDPFTVVFDVGFRCTNNDNLNIILTLWKIDNPKEYTYRNIFGYRIQFRNFIKEFSRWNRVTKNKLNEKAKWKGYLHCG